MKDLCKNIGYCVLVLGIIGSIYLAYTFGVDFESLLFSSYSHVERDWLMTIIYFVVGAASTVAFSAIFFALSEILERLEDLSHGQTEISFSSSPLGVMSDEERLANGDWKCEKCGRINDKLVGSCACGASRYQ